MLYLYAIFICNIYMLYLYAISICYIYMLYLYAIYIPIFLHYHPLKAIFQYAIFQYFFRCTTKVPTVVQYLEQEK